LVKLNVTRRSIVVMFNQPAHPLIDGKRPQPISAYAGVMRRQRSRSNPTASRLSGRWCPYDLTDSRQNRN